MGTLLILFLLTLSSLITLLCLPIRLRVNSQIGTAELKFFLLAGIQITRIHSSIQTRFFFGPWKWNLNSRNPNSSIAIPNPTNSYRPIRRWKLVPNSRNLLRSLKIHEFKIGLGKQIPILNQSLSLLENVLFKWMGIKMELNPDGRYSISLDVSVRPITLLFFGARGLRWKRV